MFELKSNFLPIGDQLHAIAKLKKGVENGVRDQTLLGVTGSGKTYTIANVIAETAKPTLVISHNKTLAGQLFQEFRDFFPNAAVSYFVSYYDYYQPEAYIPHTDTYIEKEADINDRIEKLRLQTTMNLLTRRDVIVISSVSCLYSLGNPEVELKFTIPLTLGEDVSWEKLSLELVKLQYERSDFEFKRGTFRARGFYLDVFLAYEDEALRIYENKGKISQLVKINPVSGHELRDAGEKLIIFPAKQYLAEKEKISDVESKIRADLQKEYEELKNQGKEQEAKRLLGKVNYDLEMIKEVGYVNGIENYSRYFDGRAIGDPPFTLLHYFRHAYGSDFLVVIDESHMTVPQIRAMERGDHSRKKTLIDFGFRMKAAFDNRPLTFAEFEFLAPQIIYVSATPDEWELKKSQVVEQLVRPTGIVDPEIDIRPAKHEVDDLLEEIKKRVEKPKKERVLVTALTKKNAEDLADFLAEKGIAAAYLHCDVKTLERSDTLDKLRKGEYDVLIGVNLLREGLDLPEVSLVAILDADREGFLRSKVSLIQTMGRAARNALGKVLIYADKSTDSIKQAVLEIERRRKYQLEYNACHNITPKNVEKPVRERIFEEEEKMEIAGLEKKRTEVNSNYLQRLNKEALTSYDREKMIKKLKKAMKAAAENLDFELAIQIRDKVKEIVSS